MPRLKIIDTSSFRTCSSFTLILKFGTSLFSPSSQDYNFSSFHPLSNLIIIKWILKTSINLGYESFALFIISIFRPFPIDADVENRALYIHWIVFSIVDGFILMMLPHTFRIDGKENVIKFLWSNDDVDGLKL